MRTAVHVDRSDGMRSSDIQNENPLLLRHIENLDAIGSDKLPRPWRRFAARVGFVSENIAMAEVRQLSSPVLKRRIIDVDRRIAGGVGLIAVGIDDKASTIPYP